MLNSPHVKMKNNLKLNPPTQKEAPWQKGTLRPRQALKVSRNCGIKAQSRVREQGALPLTHLISSVRAQHHQPPLQPKRLKIDEKGPISRWNAPERAGKFSLQRNGLLVPPGNLFCPSESIHKSRENARNTGKYGQIRAPKNLCTSVPLCFKPA